MLPPESDLTGRVALVTGAGSPDGIGLATARLLGRSGASVALTATTERVLDRVEELRAEGLEVFGAVADLTDGETVNRLVAETTEKLGAPTILVNNAGMTSVTRPALEGPGSESARMGDTSVDQWHRSLARNLDTAFLTARAVVPAMVAARWGRIVMVASVTGPVMAMRAEAPYAAAKAGMVGLARSAALDYASAGVTVNAVAPGWITTASQTEREVDEGAATPVGRCGTPGEVAAAICFLCTPGAAYVTGQCLVVDGGNSIAEERAPSTSTLGG